MDRGAHLDHLIAEADRLDELADTAELMGDPAGAARLHDAAVRRRERAMADLDGPEADER